MEFKYGVFLACLAFTIFLIVKEIKREDRSRLIGRLLASVLMVACFALLIIPLRYSIKRERAAGELNFYTEKTNSFADLSYHLQTHPEIKKINIYGYGLRKDELKKLKSYQLSFHPSASPSGFTSASWPNKIKATERLTVQGTYQNYTNKVVKLKFFGFGETLDSVTIKPNTQTNFSFKNQPKQLGKALFNLIAMHDKDTIAAEPVPFEVETMEPISILILASFPDFEYKFLKKWLFENQFKVALRTQISKNKYTTEFLNREAVNLNRINNTLLKDIDVVVIEEEENTPELLKAVNAGMGLIVRAKTIKTSLHHQPLLADTIGKVNVDRRLSGIGKIITTTIPSTYSWQLVGKQEEYSRFWSLLFAKALRKKMKNYAYSIEPQRPTVGEKTRLILSLPDNRPPLVSMDSLMLAPRQNMELPFLWDGFFWSKTSGWITLSVNKRLENIYIYEKTDWATAKNSEKLKATTDFVANQSKNALKLAKIEFLDKEELSSWWFFIGFVAAISFLWYEQRFLASK
ncbi:MAG: hypothetical protein KAY27_04880 [Pedobacter sp.]|nr:hypothetical protein [Pedobacter sp.]